MSETFYPFVENAATGDIPDIEPPAYAARIAVYDAMTVPPRVIIVPPTDVRTYLDEITKNVWELATQQGSQWPFHIIRELVENYIHASFIEPTISIMDGGKTISFSDQGPGIPNKQAALRPTFSSATAAMKRYIRGTGSGLPMVEAQVKLQHGSITIEDNLNQGVVVTVSLVDKNAKENNVEERGSQISPTPTYTQQTAQFQGYMQPQPWQVQGQPAWNPLPYPVQPGMAVQNPYTYPAPPQPFAQQTYQVAQMTAVPPSPRGPEGENDTSRLTEEDKAILRLFLTNEKIGTTEVAAALGISKSTGTRRIRELGECGLVVKMGQKYTLTPEGRNALARLANEG